LTLVGARPEQPVFRIGRRPDPWEWPDWRLAGPEGTFGNRWDDPLGQYRVLYASSQKLGAFLETLARFRASPQVARELAAIDGEVDAIPPGKVPASWCLGRMVSRAFLAGEYADVGQHASLAHLNLELAYEVTPALAAAGVKELDAAAIRLAVPRQITQRISRHVYEMSMAGGRPRFAGITYLSRLGDDLTNWAIFEPTPPAVESPIAVVATEPLEIDDPDFQEACELLGLEVAVAR